MVIKILEHVSSTSSYEDGEVIYDHIHRELLAGKSVEVSFSGIPSVPSAFINSAFIRLLEDIPFAHIKSKLVIRDSTRYINDLLRSRFEFAARMSGQ